MAVAVVSYDFVAYVIPMLAVPLFVARIGHSLGRVEAEDAAGAIPVAALRSIIHDKVIIATRRR
jgi:hypothetical protein